MSAITINVSQSSLPVNFFTASSNWAEADLERTADEMNFNEILFVLEGKGRLQCGGEEYPLVRGCAFYISRGIAYTQINDGNLISAFLSVKGDGMELVSKAYTENGFLFLESVDTDYWVSRIEAYISTYNRLASTGKLSYLAYEFYLDFFEKTAAQKTFYRKNILHYSVNYNCL